MQGTVAVTGATGFIGHEILQSLVSNNWQVRSLTRRPQPTNQPSVQWINGDLGDHAALRELVSGATAVIHCAGTVRGRSRAQFDRINAEGTANILQACRQEKSPGKFLLISSLAAKHPEVSWYAGSKHKAEQILAEESGDLHWTVFRPTAVYGPGDRELKPLFKTMHRFGLLPMPGFSATRFSLLHVSDLVAAVQCWLDAEPPVQGIFELADDRVEGYDRHTLAAIAQQAWGRPVRALSLPPFLIYLVAYLNLGLAHLCLYSPMLTPGKVRELLYPEWLCNNTEPENTLPGWHPQRNLPDVLPGMI